MGVSEKRLLAKTRISGCTVTAGGEKQVVFGQMVSGEVPRDEPASTTQLRETGSEEHVVLALALPRDGNLSLASFSFHVLSCPGRVGGGSRCSPFAWHREDFDKGPSVSRIDNDRLTACRRLGKPRQHEAT